MSVLWKLLLTVESRIEWSSLQSGLKALVHSAKPYKEKSCFIELIEEEGIIPEEMQPLSPTSTQSKPPTADDMEALNDLYVRLHDVRNYVGGNQQGQMFIDQLIEFVSMLQSKTPIASPQEQFEASKLVRTAMASIPADFMRGVRREPKTMIAVTYFFVAVLVVQPLFPAMGAMVSILDEKFSTSFSDICSSSVAWLLHPSLKYQGTWTSSGIIQLQVLRMTGLSQ
jgi:hypothetical protein